MSHTENGEFANVSSHIFSHNCTLSSKTYADAFFYHFKKHAIRKKKSFLNFVWHMIKHKAHKPTRYAKMQNQYTTNQVFMLYQLPALEVKISEFKQKPAIQSRSIAKGHSVSA